MNLSRVYRKFKIALHSADLLIDKKIVHNLKKYYSRYDAVTLGLNDSSSLDLGCGVNPRNPFNAKNIFGVDIRESIENKVKYADLATEAIPFCDNCFDFITAYDFLEHIPRVIYTPERRLPFIELMNEVHRTLKPDGIFLSSTPVYPFSPAFQDPTHVNIITPDTFSLYFDDKSMLGKMYGFNGSFKIRHQVIFGPHLVSFLQK